MVPTKPRSDTLPDETPTMIATGDLRRLYAKIDAHESILRILIHAHVDSSEDPSEAFEMLRSVTMDEGEALATPRESPITEFIDQGRVETMAFIAETFSVVKEGRDGSAD
jgi:hypothetical protein